MLIAARAVQGLGAAILSPAALSIITTTFDEGSERNKALGIWGAMGGSGAAVGVLLGGILTKALGWEWIFFVNVPIGAFVLATTRSIVKREPRRRRDPPFRRARRRADHERALTARLRPHPGEPRRLGHRPRRSAILIASAALHVAFIAVEHRSQAPLVPLGIFTGCGR